MTTLNMNLVGRVKRFPKPSSVRGALQPLFEAIMNAIHAVQDRQNLGKVLVTIERCKNKNDIKIIVKDNGAGLNKENWTAFQTTDTENKIKRGGKGVGRLYWLDCF